MGVWIKTLWGKITAFAVGAVAVMTIIDYSLKWRIYSYLGNFLEPYLNPIFSQWIITPIYLIIFLVVLLILLITLSFRNRFKKKEYFILVKSVFNTGYEPSDYSRQTKWNYKNKKDYYFIPLLSHGYNSVEFVDLCGPYCSRCNHVLHLNGSNNLGNKFICINCVKTYKIPKELFGDYGNKLFSYFREEYRQGKLREM
jgi:uncharacterized membrane protein